MKKLALLLLLLPCSLFAEEFKIPDLSQGMWSYPSANKIPDNSASYIQNFLTDIEPMAQERLGYVRRDSTVLGNSKSAHVWQFTDNTGTDWIITFSSRTFYKNTAGGTPTSFGLSASADTIPDAAKNLGKIWFVNGTDYLWWFDGTSTGSVSAAPLGTIIEPWRTRIAIASIVGSRSTIRFSEDGSGTSWTLGGLETDPFSIEIGGANDGEYVRCLKGSYLDAMIVGRKYDLWAVDGFDQSDLTVRNISSQVGCIESRTMEEVDGELVFVSARGIEAMSGRQIRTISEPIRDISDVIVKNTANIRSNTQTSASDFGAGTMDNSVYLDTNTTPGSVRLTFPDTFETYRDGSNSTKSVWVSSRSYYGSLLGVPLKSTVTVSGDKLSITMEGGTLASAYAQTARALNNYAQGTTYYVTVSSVPYYNGGLERFNLVFSSLSFSSSGAGAAIPLASDRTSFFGFSWSAANSTSATLSSVSNDKSDASLLTSTTSAIPFNFSVWLSTTNFSYAVNGVQIKAGSHTWDNRAIYSAIEYRHGGDCTRNVNCTDATLLVDNFGVTPQTATYTSQLISIGNSITSWSVSTISDVKTGGNISYTFGSTSTASIGNITNYATISNGGVPSVSTNPYAAFKAVFSNTLATSTVRLDEYYSSWNEGGLVPSPVAGVYNQRYWLSFTTSTASSPSLDAILVWQRNKSFTLFKGIYAASFAIWRDFLYFGNSNNTGLVYKYDVGNNDDGANIDSMIVTKSYDLGNFFRDKEFSKAYVGYFGGSDQSGTFTLSYNLNRYGTAYSLGSADLTDEIGQNVGKFWFPLTQLVRGREIQYTLSKTGTGNRLKLYDLLTQFEIKEEK
jgi:hypothetical protein